MIKLRDGSTVEDPRLDRLPSFDPRSVSYPVMATIEVSKPRSYTWRCDYYFDQGQEGACVGFSVAHELSARPVAVKGLGDDFARELYRAAQKVDEFPGENYSGTSVLAGIKTAQSMGYFGEYRWAFSLNDLVMAVGYKGPAVLGINWYEGMFRPDPAGFIHPSGNVAGGHAILCNGVDVKGKRFRLHNSWGTDWGVGGDCYLSFEDMERLLTESGDACIPVKRTKPKNV